LGAPLYIRYNSSDCSRIVLGSLLQRLSAVVMLELTKVDMAVNEPNISQGTVSVCSLPEPELRSCERLYCVHVGVTVRHSNLLFCSRLHNGRNM